jgi:hypothetical protein
MGASRVSRTRPRGGEEARVENGAPLRGIAHAFSAAGRAGGDRAAHALLDEVHDLSHADRERLRGYLEGTGKMILVEPGALLTEASRMPGLDGQKMSKSYGNTITLREDATSVTHKLRRMPTDPGARSPQRCRRSGQLSGLAIASGVFGRRPARPGCSKVAAAPASAAWTASSR